jgi:electron transfer flavoprotein alpha subunit
MQKIGLLIETNAAGVKPALNGVITAARGPEHELYGLVFDGKGAAYRDELQNYGIHKIVNVQSAEGLLSWNPDNWAKAVAQVMEQLGINILFGLTTSQTKDVFPRIAAILDAPLLLDCIGVDLETLTAEKSQFSGKTIATFKLRGAHYLPRLKSLSPVVAACKMAKITGSCMNVQMFWVRRSVPHALRWMPAGSPIRCR